MTRAGQVGVGMGITTGNEVWFGSSTAAGASSVLTGSAWFKFTATNAMFKETMLKTGQFSTHFVSLTSDVEKFGKTYKFIYKQYASESEMLYDFLYNYARHAPLITGWFFWGYDWQYIMNRCKRLNLDISFMSPTGQWYEHKITVKNEKVSIMLPQHKLIVDYLEIYKKWDRTIDVKENDTLDFVAEAALGVRKIKYPGTLKELFVKDYEQYILNWLIDSQWVNLVNLNMTEKSVSRALITRTMDFEQQLSLIHI